MIANIKIMKNIERKQKKIQRSARRRLNKEKRLVKMLHDRTKLEMFNNDSDNIAMYDSVLNGVRNENGEYKELNYDDLDATSKRTHNFCKKYIMMQNIAELEDLDNDRIRVRNDMMRASNRNTYNFLNGKYVAAREKHRSLYEELTETPEQRNLYKYCKNIASININF